MEEAAQGEAKYGAGAVRFQPSGAISRWCVDPEEFLAEMLQQRDFDTDELQWR